MTHTPGEGPMEAERARRVEELFAAAAEKEASGRAAFLDVACAGDASLRAEVESLLRADEDSSGFLSSPAYESSSLFPSGLGLPGPQPAEGSRLGAYRIVRPIAAGGMGTVYEAIQESPHRSVALKVMRTGLASASALRRFRYESELLGRLAHPGIARVYEAGVWEEGATPFPYFAMELVRDPKPITTYVRDRGLDRRARLELFADVCDAVQHGHQRGVIHRDLKPANILVDPKGAPKVIDFGVARASDTDVAVSAANTRTGQLVGTLQYMSPEQCGADLDEVDTRSDVYALGLVLYELLCERRPYELSGVSIAAAAEIIRERPPVRPSAIDRSLRGDLETIVLQALDKDRERRFASAAELAQDVRRFLVSRPIQARADSAWYVLAKALRRHRWPVSGALAFLVVLAVALVVSLSYWREAVAQGNLARDRLAQAEANREFAQQRADVAFRTLDFLDEILGGAHPNEAQGRDTELLRQILQRAADRSETELADAPEVRAWVERTVGGTYLGLGMYGEAEECLVRAVDLLRRSEGESDPATIDAMVKLSRVYFMRNRLSEGEQILKDVLGMIRRDGAKWAGFRSAAFDEMSMQVNLAGMVAEQGRMEEAATLLRDVVERADPETELSIVASGSLANIHLDREEWTEAEELLRAALERSELFIGDRGPVTIQLTDSLVKALRGKGEPSEAEPIARRNVEMHRRVFGAEDFETLIAEDTLASVLEAQAKWSEAEPFRRRCAELGRVVIPEGNRAFGLYLQRYGRNLTQLGRYAEAQDHLFEARDVLERTLGPHDEAVAVTLDNLIELYDAWGKPDRAREIRASR